ncbi:SAM-dependent methyltransferase [Phyllobacterium zundukense]|uniref:Cyclopropane-fatty-acyl-phospholipid synthase family protein n=1 Tax=Phyllobacterium zundukense TaxID=1867719 RepID=A0ACD4CXJ7_9HYPH|nr:cyclopropane-fatty-acyl-phospholipid synthase family protein [Phyllobacterium zundukense]UXN58341.1 cyclopropane-fatty-acyl-phospholipid synthase family protein [Phyllobacterium zundukense]
MTRHFQFPDDGSHKRPKTLADRALHAALLRIVGKGRLTVTTAKGKRLSFGDGSGPAVSVRFTDSRAQLAFLADADMRLGELFMEGRFVVEEGSIYDFIALLLREAQNSSHPWPARFIDSLRARFRKLKWPNLPGRSKRNVAHHYDLDGRLYELFLDTDRQYSCAYFEHPDQSLEEAQLAKKRHLAAKLLLEPHQRVLDIGCGWGGLARHIGARLTKGEVLGITLSEEQLAYARSSLGQGDSRVSFELQDYRHLKGRFDRIVSVGMFEHVGAASYGTFFKTCARLLDDDGVMVLHTIGCSSTPGFTTPWLNRYIFPGGYIPSLSEIVPHIEKAGMMATDVEVLRLHYASTLEIWRERFMAKREAAKALYDERFCRMWEFYLAAAEAAFRYEDLVVFQIQMAKRNGAVPLTRNYIRDDELHATRNLGPLFPAP